MDCGAGQRDRGGQTRGHGARRLCQFAEWGLRGDGRIKAERLDAGCGIARLKKVINKISILNTCSGGVARLDGFSVLTALTAIKCKIRLPVDTRRIGVRVNLSVEVNRPLSRFQYFGFASGNQSINAHE